MVLPKMFPTRKSRTVVVTCVTFFVFIVVMYSLTQRTTSVRSTRMSSNSSTSSLRRDTTLMTSTRLSNSSTSSLQLDDTTLRKSTGLIKSFTNIFHRDKTFNEVLLSHACSDRSIILSVFDTSYAAMAFNLYVTSFVKFNITNYLFIGADPAACQLLQRYQHGSIACASRFNDKDGKRSSQYGSESFRRKTHLKTIVILDALYLDLNVLIVDLDIVFFHNPLPYFSRCPTCDVQIQSDMHTGNSGFYFVRPTKAAKYLHRESLLVGARRRYTNQVALSVVLQSMRRRDKKSIMVQTLKDDAFPCGKIFFEKLRIVFTDDVNKCANCTMMHNNWIVGKQAKIYRFKEIGMWHVDSDVKSANNAPVSGYYSNPHRRYITYENVRDFGPVETLQRETNALKSALYIGHLLKRTLILPSFHCYGCTFGKRALESCRKINRCFYQSNKICLSILNKLNAEISNNINGSTINDRCSLCTHYKISSFDAQFSDAYREHVFLQHPKVPDVVKQSRSSLKLIESPVMTRSHLANELGNDNIFTPKNLMTGATRAEILSWFMLYRDLPVLRFHSLYGAVSNKRLSSGTNDIGDRKIFQKLKSGLLFRTFRQY